MPLTVKNGNILHATEPFIFHQCNVITKTARGVAKQIFQAFPQANTYSSGYRRVFGTASFHPSLTKIKPTIINAYAQRTPGKPKTREEMDGRRRTLERILFNLPSNVHSIAVPWKIGCGLAGGDWSQHLEMLQRFEKSRAIHIVLYKIGESE
jgi:O-acetyl-ADP-ribose deacetylase (regulator of RNase III)